MEPRAIAVNLSYFGSTDDDCGAILLWLISDVGRRHIDAYDDWLFDENDDSKGADFCCIEKNNGLVEFVSVFDEEVDPSESTKLSFENYVSILDQWRTLKEKKIRDYEVVFEDGKYTVREFTPTQEEREFGIGPGAESRKKYKLEQEAKQKKN